MNTRIFSTHVKYLIWPCYWLASLCPALLSICLLALDVYSTICTDSHTGARHMGMFWRSQSTTHRAEQVEVNSPAVHSRQTASRPQAGQYSWGKSESQSWGWGTVESVICHYQLWSFYSHRTGSLQSITPNYPSEVGKPPEDRAADTIFWSWLSWLL